MQRFPAPAKLNLFLHVVGRRADGYHLLQTVFRLIDLCDWIGIESRADGRIVRVNDVPGVAPEADLVVRAATLLREHAGVARGATIAVEKHIPMGGGLGGIALNWMLHHDGIAADAPRAAAAKNPLAERKPHFEPKAKRVIFLFMVGGPSQIPERHFAANRADAGASRPSGDIGFVQVRYKLPGEDRSRLDAATTGSRPGHLEHRRVPDREWAARDEPGHAAATGRCPGRPFHHRAETRVRARHRPDRDPPRHPDERP